MFGWLPNPYTGRQGVDFSRRMVTGNHLWILVFFVCEPTTEAQTSAQFMEGFENAVSLVLSTFSYTPQQAITSLNSAVRVDWVLGL